MSAEDRAGEQGFLLLGLIVAIFLILLALSVAAPKMARELRREREVETVRRGNQYVRAIQLFYRKFGHYPGSMDQLEKSNNIRFLRQDYIDPMTGKSDWRIIKVGENKTTVKGFFGKPLAGIQSSGLGSAAGNASSFGSPGAPGSTPGGSSFGSSGFGSSMGGGSSPGSSFGSSGLSSGGLGAGNSNAPGAAGSSATGSSTSSSGFSSTSASNFTGSQGPIMGVGLARDGDSIITLNEQTTYNTWEFIYDPRIEQLKARGALLGGAGSATAAGFGSGSASGFGSSSGSGVGSGSSSFGSSGSTGFGSSSPTSGTGSNSPNPNSNPQ